MGRSSSVVYDRVRIERIQSELKTIRLDRKSIEEIQETSREMCKIDVDKLLRPFTI
jgi:hypothetical protein